MRDANWWMDELALDTERAWNDLCRHWASRSRPQRVTWRPRSDLVEGTDDFYLFVDLPGVRRDGLRIGVCGEVIGVEGHREAPRLASPARYLRKEIGVGPFGLAVRLPFAPDPRSLVAELSEGCLRVRVPKKHPATTESRTVIEVRL
ncbi:MAG: Hsp20/alpha crystallin family protein [Planctomycetes bacterium]|nr:Hsp20/alpha crystallin family protein [Planctomycetota bacterium]